MKYLKIARKTPAQILIACQFLVVATIGFVLSTPLCAQAPPKYPDGLPAQQIPQQKPEADLEFWISSPHTKSAAAAEVIIAREPLLILALRSGGKQNLVWGLEIEKKDDPQLAPPLNRKWLKYVAQRDGLAFPDIRRKAPDEITPAEKYEIKAYNEALVNVARSSAEVFAQSAKGKEYLTFGHLFREPWKYQGQVIPIKGRLVRLRKEEAPLAAQKQLVSHFWEGWVFTNTSGSNPVCVAFARIPDGVTPGEKISYPIEFNGYFFRRYGYISQEGNQRTLFFFAPTFRVVGPSRGGISNIFSISISQSILGAILGVGLSTVIVILLLSWWFRRDDAAVQKKLRDARLQLAMHEFIDPGHEETNSPPMPINGSDTLGNSSKPPGQENAPEYEHLSDYPRFTFPSEEKDKQ